MTNVNLDDRGTNFAEYYWGPSEYYMPDRDVRFWCKPLIDTSLKELSEMKWGLVATCRHVTGFSHTRVRVKFVAPAGQQGWPFLIFKAWFPGKLVKPEEILDQLYSGTFSQPNFSRPPTFGMPLKQTVVKEKEVIREVTKYTEESEYEFLVRMNEERAERIRQGQKGRMNANSTPIGTDYIPRIA